MDTPACLASPTAATIDGCSSLSVGLSDSEQQAALPLGLSGFKAAACSLNKVLLETGVGGWRRGRRQSDSAAASGCHI